MEQNLPVVAKKFWNIVRVAFFMLRKGISKKKLMLDLNLMMKRGKLAGKAMVHNLVFHHHSPPASSTPFSEVDITFSAATPPNAYEFSCSTTPAHPNLHFPFPLNKRKHTRHHRPSAASADSDEVVMVNAAVMKALEMIQSGAESPALPGFGRTPVVRQLRVTDSPFPVRDGEEDNHQVDKAAEDFIMRFYSDLRKQNAMSA